MKSVAWNVEKHFKKNSEKRKANPPPHPLALVLLLITFNITIQFWLLVMFCADCWLVRLHAMKV